MSALSDFASKYQNNLLTGLAGGAVGAGLTAFNTDRMEGESDATFRRRRFQNAMGGALAGGATGFAAPTLLNGLKAIAPEKAPAGKLERLKALMNPMKNDGAAAVAGGAAGAVGGGVVSTGLKATANATGVGKNMMQSAVQETKDLIAQAKLEGNPAKLQALQERMAKLTSVGAEQTMVQGRLGKLWSRLSPMGTVRAMDAELPFAYRSGRILGPIGAIGGAIAASKLNAE